MKTNPEHIKSTTLDYSDSNTIKTSEPTPEAKKGVRVLMAEDNLVNQKLTTLLFKKLNFEVDMVSNGSEAVDAVLENEYDLVFMDIQMPIMDGVEASQEIQKRLGDKAPAIVALTANAMEGDRDKYLKAGMDSYIAKPITLGDLRVCIERFITV